jgi:hypothetical protein
LSPAAFWCLSFGATIRTNSFDGFDKNLTCRTFRFSGGTRM